MNKVILRGNLGNDPELRYTGSGRAVSNFRIATNERYVDKQGQRHENTEWHRIVAWGKLGENCAKHLSKGRGVLIEGKLQTREWTDRDEVKRYTTEVIAQSVEFLNDGKRTDTNPQADSVPEAEIGQGLEADAEALGL